jgi:isopentenyl-diphosphate delta-isomerase
MNQVILVDTDDNELGIMEKIEAHEKGLLHRAFSIFLFNSSGQILLQQRADSKYHSPGLWTNACCSHPGPNETVLDGAKRRLMEELGISTFLTQAFYFEYRTEFTNGLTEHELDHVFVGYTNENPILNDAEAKAFKWISLESLMLDLQNSPDNYTVWFKIILNQHFEKIQKELCHARM